MKADIYQEVTNSIIEALEKVSLEDSTRRLHV